jgi:hypothetical protein
MVEALAREADRSELTARFADKAAPPESAIELKELSVLCVVAVIFL